MSEPNLVDQELRDEYDFSQAIRGNPHSSLNKSQIRIETVTGDREVQIRTVEVNAIVGTDGKVTIQLPSDIPPGEYPITLLIQQNL